MESRIQYVPNIDIDREKYDRCVRLSPRGRIYAQSWYLDCVTERWDVLVLGDYEAVMPFARRRKYGISYIYPPPWTQQLGVFGEDGHSSLSEWHFLRSIPFRFLFVDYMLGAESESEGPGLAKRSNFVLRLDRDFDALREGFNANRRRISRYPFEGMRLEREGDAEELLRLYAGMPLDYPVHRDGLQKMKCLLREGKNAVSVWTVHRHGSLLGGLIWCRDARRITYLLPVNPPASREWNLSSFVLLRLIRDFQGSGLELDLMGSMDHGVSDFYRSFGATEEVYYRLQRKFTRHVPGR